MTFPSRSASIALVAVIAVAVFGVAIGLSGCAEVPPRAPSGALGAAPEASAPSEQAAADPFASLPPPAVQERLLALDPNHLTDTDVRDVLAKGPAPHIMLVHGGVYPAYLLMKSFGTFLVRMGYPESAIRNPDTGDWSYSPYEDGARIAGIVAWEYETSGLRPMLIGHSLGGIQTVHVLQDLAGEFGRTLHVYDPVTHRYEARTTIVDPYTGRARPVVGVSVSYASSVGAGGAGFLLPDQWEMIGRLKNIPDTVDEFTGFSLGIDLIAWNFPGVSERYHATGTAHVRDVVLPDGYSHMFVPLTASLPRNPEVRAWINAWTPASHEDPSTLPEDAQRHVLWAADVWYSVKRHWCLEAQHLVRAARARDRDRAATARNPHATARNPAASAHDRRRDHALDGGKAPAPVAPPAG